MRHHYEFVKLFTVVLSSLILWGSGFLLSNIEELKMKIICPHCAVENELSDHDLNCAKCKQTLKGHTYKKKTAILVTVLVFVAGGVGG